MKLSELIPRAELVEAMPLAELAGCILQVLEPRLRPAQEATCLNNFARPTAEEYSQHGRGAHDGVLHCCAEAWDWLVVHGMLGHHPKHGDNWFTVTRLGRAVAGRENFARWVADRELPDDMAHEQLRAGALALFRQGRLDTAVFDAFKTLEVAIRDAAGLGHEFIGTRLVGKAFNVECGPLTDLDAEPGERTALLNLMSGAIGSYKNPHSHRHVEITPAEARELLLLASHLLRIVEGRRVIAS